MLRTRYPRMEVGDPSAQVTAWHMTLEDVPYSAAERALSTWFKERRWPPDPSELRELILAAMNEAPDAHDAWEIVIRHMRDNGLIGGKPFQGPRVIDQAVRAIGGWYALRMSTETQRDRDAFLKAYGTYARRALSEVNIGELVRVRLGELGEGGFDD